MAQAFLMNSLVTRAIGYSLALATLWAVLAAMRPSTTYHLAPLLVSVTAPAFYRMLGGRSRSTGTWLAIAGLGIAATMTALLGVVGLLAGPSLLPFGDGIVESLVGSAAGGAVGVLVAMWPLTAETV